MVRTLLPAAPRPRKLRFGLARGTRMIVDFRKHLAVYFGRYERELNAHFRRLVQPGIDAFDIGGHIGYDALAIANLARVATSAQTPRGGRVLSIEANPRNLKQMQANFALNPELQLFAKQAYIAERTDASGKITIDRLAEEFFPPAFIKMDIEGAEADALDGAEQVLRTVKPRMIIEVHGEEIEARCLARLKQVDYQVTIVNPRSGWIRESRGVEHNRWLVCE